MDNPNSISSQHEQDHVDLTENCKNECLQYLLNELAPEQVRLFEERLGKSDQLAVELQRQAEMIVTLSEASTLPDALSKPTLSATTQNAIIHQRRVLVKVFGIAIAVCVAGFLFRTWWSSTGPQQETESPSDRFATRVMDNEVSTTMVSESTLIARAWAAAQTADQSSENGLHTSLAGIGTQAINSRNDDHDNELESEEQEMADASGDAFSWMFTATFEIHEMDTNDG